MALNIIVEVLCNPIEIETVKTKWEEIKKIRLMYNGSVPHLMAKYKLVKHKSLLIVLLILVPVFIMRVMGFGNYNANEFNILVIALLADMALYLGYYFLLKTRRNP